MRRIYEKINGRNTLVDYQYVMKAGKITGKIELAEEVEKIVEEVKKKRGRKKK